MDGDAKVWDQLFQKRRWGKWPDTRFVEFVMRTFGPRVTPREDTWFLELGCGAGAQLKFLTEEGFGAWGLDGSPTVLAAAAANAPKATLHPHDLNKGLMNLPHLFQRDYDCVVDVCTLQHLTGEAKARAIVHALTMLRPGGYLFSMHSAHGTSLPSAPGVPEPWHMLESEIPHVYAGLDLKVSLQTVRANGTERRHWIIEGRKIG